MPDKRISELAAILAAAIADNDLLALVDIDDATMAASGTDRGVTVAELGKAIPALRGAVKLGNLTVLGHSYCAGSTQSDSGVANVYQQSVVAKLQGLLGIDDRNVRNYGQAASRLTGNVNNVSTSEMAGWVTALQFFVPNSSINVDSANDVVSNDQFVACNGATLIVHGINDIVSNTTSFPTQGLTAWAHAMRTVLSRARCALWFGSTNPATTITWDATIAFVGTWSNFAPAATPLVNSGPAYKRSQTNTDYVEITIPQDFPGGVIAVCFSGQANGYTTLSGTMTNVATSMPVTSAAEFPTSGAYVAHIAAEGANTAEDVLVTAGQGTTTWTVTRGVNGTSASAHGSGAVVTVQPTSLVTWSTSGANGSITGTTSVTAQGFAGSNAPVTKRFVCTGADAGKTIRATISGHVASDAGWVNFDSWWIESPEPGPTVVADVPYHWYTSMSTLTFAQIDTLVQSINTSTASVVAEFDSWVKKLDTYTIWKNRAGTVTGAMIVENPSTVTWVANDPTFVPKVGMRMTWGQFFTPEHADIQVVTALGGGSYTLQLRRGAGGTGVRSHAAGDMLAPIEYMHTDGVHLSIRGHSVFAQEAYDALVSMPTPAKYQIASVQGNWSQASQSLTPGLMDNTWSTAPISVFATVAVAQNKEGATLRYIPRDCVLTGIGCVVSTGTVAGIAFGVYFPDYTHCRPGRLLCDFGKRIDSTQTAPWVSAQTGVYLLLRMGWYWFSAVQQATAVTLRTVGQNGGCSLPSAAVQTAALTVQGFSRTGMSGALTDWSSWTEESATPNLPVIWIKTRSVNFA